MAHEISDIPPDMQKVYRHLRRWRSSHARRVPFPDALRAAAGELARGWDQPHGESSVCFRQSCVTEKLGPISQVRHLDLHVTAADLHRRL